MPIRKKDYPYNWKAISLAVRAEAGQRCEWCGAPNGAVIQRRGRVAEQGEYRIDWVEVIVVETTTFGEHTYENTSGMSWDRLRFHGLTRIVLTVAHLDRDTKNNDRNNLAALCQRCHLRHDILQHLQNRKYGRYHTRDHQFKLI